MKKVQNLSTHLFARNLIVVLAFFGIFFSNRALASVIFSEIAWMGGKNSSADEWIELYNPDQSTSLDGFTIESESKKLLIKLSGSIDSQGFYLIERTDDNTLPDISASLVSTFGTGLSNSGDLIYLKDADGQIVDTLNFANGWPAGDNTTKQTMQKSSGAWLTGDPTPKAKNISNQTDTNTSPAPNQSQNLSSSNSSGSSTSSNTSQTSSGGGGYSPVIKNLSRFIVLQTGDSLTNTSIDFEIDHRDDSGQKVFYGLYKVNFGDGLEAFYEHGDKITHIYEYPGQYRVTAKYFESKWSLLPKKQTFIDLNIYEPSFSIDLSRAPIVVIKNTGSKDLDISNFVFNLNTKSFTPPKGSVVFAGQSLWLSPKITGFGSSDGVDLKVATVSGSLVFGQNNSVANTLPNQLKSVTKKPSSSVVSNSLNNVLANNFSPIYSTIDQNDINLATINSSEFVQKQKPKQYMIWALFAVLIIGGSLILIKLRRRESAEAENFTLIEE